MTSRRKKRLKRPKSRQLLRRLKPRRRELKLLSTKSTKLMPLPKRRLKKLRSRSNSKPRSRLMLNLTRRFKSFPQSSSSLNKKIKRKSLLNNPKSQKSSKRKKASSRSTKNSLPRRNQRSLPRRLSTRSTRLKLLLRPRLQLKRKLLPSLSMPMSKELLLKRRPLKN